MKQPFKYHVPVKIRYNDTDLQGRVYFSQYYTFFDEGVEGYLAAIGYDYPTMLNGNIDFVFAESHCSYKSPATWPEVLRVYTRIGHIGNRSLRFEFEAVAATDDRLVVTGHIVAVTVDRQHFKPRPVPEALRQAVAAFEGEG